MSEKFYVTAAIPYVNGDPHIGHALEFVQADTIHRYHKLLNQETAFLCGSDENGLKMVQAAGKKNLTVTALCDQNAAKFQDLFQKLNTSLTIFQRASSESHKIGSQKLWQLCAKNDDIYKNKYAGLYCVGCETFYKESDLIDGKCPEHLTIPEMVEEENYFFRLSKYQKQLIELIENDKLKIVPQTRKNEILSFLKNPLEDFSISRSQKRAQGWGIPVPEDPNQIIYIWFDALNVYQTGIGFGTDNKQYQKWWPADVHVIGKGIIRFHAVYWPAILMSAGLPLPKSILVHGYIISGGQKMSKSLGNVIDPFTEIEKYGAEAVRYYLLSAILPCEDGDYNKTSFEQKYNADLANGLGNLVARVAKLCEKSGINFETSKTEFKDTLAEHHYHKYLAQFRFNEALNVIWEKIKKLDQKINTEAPWKLIKENSPHLKTALTFYVNEVRTIACLLAPFLPETAAKITAQFQGQKIKSEVPLFPRVV